MVLMKYDKEPLPGCETVYMFGGQEGLQKFLVIFAVLCVPVLLLGKPIYLKMQMKKNSHAVIIHPFLLEYDTI